MTPTRTSYDILDRSLSVANPANETTAFAYSFGPERGGAQTPWSGHGYDPLDQIVSVTDSRTT